MAQPQPSPRIVHAVARVIPALLIAGVSLLCMPGCAAVMAAKQPNKKDLSLLAPGVPRTHLIAELGAPTWSEEREGQVTDVFAFKQGYQKPVKAGRALFHGAADVFTGGLWEVVAIPAETLADGSDVKVEVKYDPHRIAESITVIEGENVIHPQPLLAKWRKPRGAHTATTMPAVGAQVHGTSIAKNVIGIPDEPASVHSDRMSVDRDQLR